MPEKRKSKKASTPEGREQQLMALAYDRAEEKLRDGTASNQLIVYFLKAGSEKDRLEREKLEAENLMLRAKRDSLESSARIEEAYANAMKAFKEYHGDSEEEEYDE